MPAPRAKKLRLPRPKLRAPVPPEARRSLREDALNLPNALTMLRVFMIPLVLWLIADGTPQANFWAAMVYIVAALTDAIDGWLARKKGLVSVFGQFLDPLADKLLVMATLVFLVDMNRAPSWAVAIILARELSVSALRTIAISEGVVIAAGQSGKEKTAIQMVAILLLILHQPYAINFWFFTVPIDLQEAGMGLLYLSVIFAVMSAGEYIKLFVEAVEAKDRRLGRK